MPHLLALCPRARTVAALLACWLATASFALPQANKETGGDPAPKALLPKPPPAAAAAAAAPLPDTTALLPSGEYLLRLTLKGETLAHPVKIGRNGGSVNAAMGGGEVLSGTLDPAGKLHLAGGNASDRIDLSATVVNRRAAGQAQLGRGANRMNGSFTLDPAVQGAKKLQEYGAPKPSKAGTECGFFCRMGKAWDCLKNWSKC
jgi:hypothetical protein